MDSSRSAKLIYRHMPPARGAAAKQSYAASYTLFPATTRNGPTIYARAKCEFLPPVLTGCIVGSISPDFVVTLPFGSWFARDKTN
jgi:hypothetical protein